MYIDDIYARKIYGNNATSALMCDVILDNGMMLCAAVSPQLFIPMTDQETEWDTSTIALEQAIEIINYTIAPLLSGNTPNALHIDELLKTSISLPNALCMPLATFITSMAIHRAHAAISQKDLYESLMTINTHRLVQLPQPFFTLLHIPTHSISQYHIIPDMRADQNTYDIHTIIEAGIYCSHMVYEALSLITPTSIDTYGQIVPTADIDHTMILAILQEGIKQTEAAYPVNLTIGVVKNNTQMHAALPEALNERIRYIHTAHTTNKTSALYCVKQDMALIATVHDLARQTRIALHGAHELFTLALLDTPGDTFFADFFVALGTPYISFGGCFELSVMQNINRLIMINDYYETL